MSLAPCNDNELLSPNEAYAPMLSLLGKVLYLFPNREFFSVIREERLFQALPMLLDDKDYRQGEEILNAWDEKMNQASPSEIETEYENLSVDHMKLFVGVQEVLAAPWESVYFSADRSLFQRETLDVRKYYREHGLELTRIHHEPEDHLGYELEFASQLLIAAADDHSLYQVLKTFLVEHTLRFVEEWSSLVRKHASSELFIGVAYVLPPLLKSLHTELQSITS